MRLYLGIDTSCYTTSLAVTDSEGNLFWENRKILQVPEGGRGLAQNEAIFQHICNLQEMFVKLREACDISKLSGVAASTRPRPVKDSYMPVFRVAESYGRSVAAMLNLPFAGTSHQEGHLASGIWSAGGPVKSEFLAVHLSGGTTELLHISLGNDDCEATYTIRLLGGSTDLHAGQLVDRVGVKMGLPFPAGPKLEALARHSEAEVRIPSSVKGYEISFSGPEAAALRLLERMVPAPDVARAVEKCIANTMDKILRKAVADMGLKDVLIVGGVAANKYLREKLATKLKHPAVGAKLYFASTEHSTDNAVGVSLIGRAKLNKS